MRWTGPRRRALVAGWFSFEEVIATVGDLLGRDVTVAQLREAGWDCDVAVARYMGRGVDWRTVNPDDYDLLVFTTGPLHDQPLLHELLRRFGTAARWAVNVSVLSESVRERFDLVVERDSAELTRADLSWAGDPGEAPVVGIALTPPQAEYSDGRHRQVQDVITDWAARRQLAAVPLDMDMYAEHRFPRRPAQIVSLIARCDVVVSMRLHGAVLALRSGRPVVAVDAVPGGGKVTRQMRLLDWPCLLPAENCTPRQLDRALAWCRSDDALHRVRRTRARALADATATTAQLRTAARELLEGTGADEDARAS